VGLSADELFDETIQKTQVFGYAAQKEPEAFARAVFRVLSRRVSGGEIQEVRQLLPAEIRDL
jgi:uncharacterized protein (DUF2267 family)